MAWNGSEGSKGCSDVRQRERKQTRGLRWGFGAAAIVLISLVTFLVMRDGEGDSRPPQIEKPKRISEAKHFVRPTENATGERAATAAVKEDGPAPAVGTVMTARTEKVGRVMTLMDGTVVTNKSERPFKRDLEHALWVALRPGNMGAGLLTTLQNRHSDDQIVEMLKEMTVAEPDDSEGIRRIKQDVQDLKERVLQELNAGRSLADVFDEIRNQGVMESKIKADTMRLRAEAIRSGDAELVRETVRMANDLRTRQGLDPMAIPEEFQEKDMESPAQATDSEFED